MCSQKIWDPDRICIPCYLSGEKETPYSPQFTEKYFLVEMESALIFSALFCFCLPINYCTCICNIYIALTMNSDQTLKQCFL